jgi:hypothetical protein
MHYHFFRARSRFLPNGRVYIILKDPDGFWPGTPLPHRTIKFQIYALQCGPRIFLGQYFAYDEVAFPLYILPRFKFTPAPEYQPECRSFKEWKLKISWEATRSSRLKQGYTPILQDIAPRSFIREHRPSILDDYNLYQRSSAFHLLVLRRSSVLSTLITLNTRVRCASTVMSRITPATVVPNL